MPEVDQFNPLQTDKFTIMLSRRSRNASFYCSKASIPSVSGAGVDVDRPRYASSFLADTLDFSDLECDIILTEDMSSYIEIREWLEDCVQKNQELNNDFFEDIHIILYSGYNNPTRKFIYVDAFPKTIGSIELDANSDPLDAISFTVTFGYSYYKIE